MGNIATLLTLKIESPLCGFIRGAVQRYTNELKRVKGNGIMKPGKPLAITQVVPRNIKYGGRQVKRMKYSNKYCWGWAVVKKGDRYRDGLYSSCMARHLDGTPEANHHNKRHERWLAVWVYLTIFNPWVVRAAHSWYRKNMLTNTNLPDVYFKREGGYNLGFKLYNIQGFPRMDNTQSGKRDNDSAGTRLYNHPWIEPFNTYENYTNLNAENVIAPDIDHMVVNQAGAENFIAQQYGYGLTVGMYRPYNLVNVNNNNIDNNDVHDFFTEKNKHLWSKEGSGDHRYVMFSNRYLSGYANTPAYYTLNPHRLDVALNPSPNSTIFEWGKSSYNQFMNAYIHGTVAIPKVDEGIFPFMMALRVNHNNLGPSRSYDSTSITDTNDKSGIIGQLSIQVMYAPGIGGGGGSEPPPSGGASPGQP